MKASVCLVCLNTFQNDLSTEDIRGSLVFPKFLKFAEKYLQVSSVATIRFLGALNEGKEAFCENCKLVVINPICKVYFQLISAQASLSVELETLQLLLEESTTSTNSTQVEIENLYYLQPFRSSLIEKCQLKRLEFLPRIIVQRFRMTPKTSHRVIVEKNGSQTESNPLDLSDNDADSFHFTSSPDRFEPSGTIEPNGEESLIKVEPENVDEFGDTSFHPNIPSVSHILKPNLKRSKKRSKKHRHKVNQRFSCQSCDKTFGEARLLRGHWVRIHAPKGNFPCTMCSKVFTNRWNLTSHKSIYHGALRLHNCPHCELKFKFLNGLKYHIISVHLPKNLPCSQCEMMFSHNKNLKIHMLTKHPAPGTKAPPRRPEKFQPRPCPTCLKIFNTAGKLWSHVKYTHVERIQKCSQCDKAFKRKFQLQHHIATVHNKDLFTCCHCQKRFRHKLYLRRHINRMHPDPNKQTVKTNKPSFPDGPFVCPTCGKLLASSAAVSNHISKVHSEKRYSCVECEVNYKTKFQLTDHQKAVHSSETHVCHLCGKTYSTEKYLRRHILRLHPTPAQQQSWVKCEKCEKSFSKKYLLKRHSVTCEVIENGTNRRLTNDG